MSDGPVLPRRPVLLTGLAAAATATLAACSSSGPKASTASSAAPAAPSTGGGGGGALVELSAVPVGGSVSATDGGHPIIVAQPTKGAVVAFSAICTHMGCTVAPSGKQLVCPCHGSVYDAFTGKNLTGPAPSPLPAVPVKVAGGKVLPA